MRSVTIEYKRISPDKWTQFVVNNQGEATRKRCKRRSRDDVLSSNKTYTESVITNYLNDFLREILALWLKNNGLVSYNKISFYGDFCSVLLS